MTSRAVAIQAEDRIVHDVCADAQQGTVQALVASPEKSCQPLFMTRVPPSLTFIAP